MLETQKIKYVIFDYSLIVLLSNKFDTRIITKKHRSKKVVDHYQMYVSSLWRNLPEQRVLLVYFATPVIKINPYRFIFY